MKQAYKESALSSRLSCKSFDDLAASSATANASLERRLSPKVFTNTSEVLPISQSLENLKTQNELYEDLDSANNFLKQHSLQDLTAYSENIDTQVGICLFIGNNSTCISSVVYCSNRVLFVLFCDCVTL